MLFSLVGSGHLESLGNSIIASITQWKWKDYIALIPNEENITAWLPNTEVDIVRVGE